MGDFNNLKIYRLGFSKIFTIIFPKKKKKQFDFLHTVKSPKNNNIFNNSFRLVFFSEDWRQTKRPRVFNKKKCIANAVWKIYSGWLNWNGRSTNRIPNLLIYDFFILLFLNLDETDVCLQEECLHKTVHV